MVTDSISIAGAPELSCPGESLARLGESVVVECNVTGYPPPVLAVFTDAELEHPLGGDRVEVVGLYLIAVRVMMMWGDRNISI